MNTSTSDASQGGFSPSLALLEAVFRHTPVAQFVVNEQLHIRLANDLARRAFVRGAVLTAQSRLTELLVCSQHVLLREPSSDSCNVLQLSTLVQACLQARVNVPGQELAVCVHAQPSGLPVVWYCSCSYLGELGTEGLALVTFEDRSEKSHIARQLQLRDTALTHIIQSTLGSAREHFFEYMTLALAEHTKADYAFIGRRLDAETVETVCLVKNGVLLPNISYALPNSPCGHTLQQGTCVYLERVRERFPNDTLLHDLEVQGYIACPVFDQQGGPMGMVVALFCRAVPEAEAIKSLFELFSSTIGREMERKAAVEALHQSQQHLQQRNIALQHAQRKAEESDALKTQFLKNLSHEIRTPLNGIVGFAQMLSAEQLSEERRDQFVQVILESSHRLNRIVSDALDVSRIEAAQLMLDESELNIVKLFDRVLDQFQWEAGRRKIDLVPRLALHENEMWIWADQQKLYKVLEHLLDNALKFTKQGRVELNCTREGEMLVFAVVDTGMGIAQQDQELIFEHFRQVDAAHSQAHGGAGLGLSICKGFVQFWGGRIWLNSAPGYGSSFFFSLPFRPCHVPEAPASVLPPKPAKPHCTLLIAEDEELNFLYLQELLADLQATIVRAHNGLEAVELLSQFQFDLVLMDLKMPVLDGFAATRLIKERRPDLPVLAQTAYDLAHDRAMAKAAGCDGFFSKPIDAELLLAAIRKLIG